MTGIEVVPISPVLGAEIRGSDLRCMDDATFETVRRALTDHGVVFFRDQGALEPGDQIAFARRFGPLHTHPAAPHLDGRPELFVIHAHAESKIANGNGWHTDVSCDLEPPLATMLQMHEVPHTGGDTLFACTVAAFETCSVPMQRMLSRLTATHASEHVYRGRYADRGVDDTNRTYPSAVHPVVRTHPDARRHSLYVNPSFTVRINELAPAESRALLRLLYKHQQRPEFQVRFSWTPNDIALWDNRRTQHFALWDYWPEERKGHRVTVRGERPYFDGDPEAFTQRTMRLGGSL